ncbi:hypothetical protein [Methanosarcina sp. Kolksee]|nr:hypothetical protein [Methanosarcina sp. Kolksee]
MKGFEIIEDAGICRLKIRISGFFEEMDVKKIQGEYRRIMTYAN